MTITESKPSEITAGYVLEGTLLEACSCGVLCPCWIGEDPDGGQCFAFNAYHFDRGTIGDVDVSGLNLVLICHIPGNVLAGNWRAVVYVDDRCSEEQHQRSEHDGMTESIEKAANRRSQKTQTRKGKTAGSPTHHPSCNACASRTSLSKGTFANWTTIRSLSWLPR